MTLLALLDSLPDQKKKINAEALDLGRGKSIKFIRTLMAMLYSALTNKTRNIGDFVQTIAAIRFLPKVDYYIDREDMPASSFKPPSFLIANGWYMHKPENFPPPDNIHPFYISIHIEHPSMLSIKTIAHFKKHEPIGCRDNSTFELLRSKGVFVYLSGCLTLTLKNRFGKRSDNVYIVDVDDSFLDTIPESIKSKAVFISHVKRLSIPWRALDVIFPDIYTRGRIALAQSYLDSYARAKLVITSRLHCFFPCLAFHTPTVLLIPKKVYSPSRLLSVQKLYQNVYLHDQKGSINWDPAPQDFMEKAKFLSNLTKKAVEIQDNPLKYHDIKYFCEGSWRPEASG